MSDPQNLIRHGASVRTLAAAILGDPHAADDVAQEAFLAALRGGTIPVRDPGAWLRGVARNLARRWIRTESRRRRREEVRPTPVAPATPDETAARLETETSLTDAVKALAEPYRTVVVLRYFDGLSTAEAAARTGVPEATVKTRLRRALAMLRDALDKRYGARGVWIPLLVRVTWPNDPSAVAAVSGATALVAGGAVMAKKILIVTVVAAVLAAVFVAPNLWESSALVPSPEGAPEEAWASAEGGTRDPAAGSRADAGGATSREVAAERFRVAVFHPDGSAAEGARVRLVDLYGETAGGAATDANGAALLPATGKPGVVHVSPRNAAPVRRDVTATAGGELVVHLEIGSVISGTLFFGESPAARVEVRLSSLDDSVPQLSMVTDDRGRFEFTGLPAGSRFSFFAGWRVYFVEPAGEMNVHLTAPATDLAIRAKRYPGVRGIVVDPDGKPVGKAVVDLSYQTVDGDGGSTRAVAGADGRFEVYTGARTTLESVRIVVGAPKGAARETIDVAPARLADGAADLGKITLRPSRTFTFVVRGPDGKPVAGALVLPEGERRRMSPPTDASGMTTLEVAAATTSVLAGAPGAGVADVSLPEETAKPVPVRLPGGTMLTVRVRTREGRVPAYLRLDVVADADVLAVPTDALWLMYDRAGMSPLGGSHVTDEMSRLNYTVPATGIVRIAGIRPGVGFRVNVRDFFTDEVLESRELRFAERERRDVDVVVSLEEKMLLVKVADPAGKPLSPAYVDVTVGNGTIQGTTGVSGVAVIPGIRGEECLVTVEMAGRVPFTGRYAVATLPKEIPVVLRPGRTVRLTVTDAAGGPVVCEEATARAAGLDHVFQGRDLDGGVFLFRNLPAGKVRVGVDYAGARHEVDAGAADREVRITVPATGSVVVRFEGLLEKPVMHRMRLVPTSAGAGTEVSVDIGYYPKRKRWEIRIPAVLPGTYRVALEHYSKTTEDGKYVYEKFRDGPEIKVAADRETETRLR